MLVLIIFSCKKEIRLQFSDEVLNQEYISIENEAIAFKDILKQYQGKQIVIDIWASWCKDCIVGFPKVADLQHDKPDAVYLFLSADRSKDSWKRSIKKYDLKGAHYFLPNGTKGALGDYIDIDWIPRYMVVDSQGNIQVFDAIEADDPNIRNALK